MEESEKPRERLSLPERRALGAIVGAAIAMLGWFLTERMRHPGGFKLAETAPDQSFQLALIFLPMLVAWGLGLLIALKRPATRSLAFASAVTLAALATGSLIYAVVGALLSREVNLLEFVLAFLFVLFFSFVRIGYGALIAGWLFVFLWDRWMLGRARRS